MGQIRAQTWEYTNFGELSGGHEALKGIYFCWQLFAGNDFWTLLAGKQRIKFSLNGIIIHHFSCKIIRFITKQVILDTLQNISLGIPASR